MDRSGDMEDKRSGDRNDEKWKDAFHDEENVSAWVAGTRSFSVCECRVSMVRTLLAHTLRALNKKIEMKAARERKRQRQMFKTRMMKKQKRQ